jgi:hypothetical protein
MAKQKRTAAELAVIIRDELGDPFQAIDIHPGTTRGWRATAITARTTRGAGAVQMQIEHIVQRLQSLYDLDPD